MRYYRETFHHRQNENYRDHVYKEKRETGLRENDYRYDGTNGHSGQWCGPCGGREGCYCVQQYNNHRHFYNDRYDYDYCCHYSDRYDSHHYNDCEYHKGYQADEYYNDHHYRNAYPDCDGYNDKDNYSSSIDEFNDNGSGSDYDNYLNKDHVVLDDYDEDSSDSNSYDSDDCTDSDYSYTDYGDSDDCTNSDYCDVDDGDEDDYGEFGVDTDYDDNSDYSDDINYYNDADHALEVDDHCLDNSDYADDQLSSTGCFNNINAAFQSYTDSYSSEEFESTDEDSYV